MKATHELRGLKTYINVALLCIQQFARKNGAKIPLLIKHFFKTLYHKLLIIQIIKIRSMILLISNHLPTHGFFIEKKKFKLIFQTGLKNCGISWVLSLIYYVLKSKDFLENSEQKYRNLRHFMGLVKRKGSWNNISSLSYERSLTLVNHSK